MNQLKRNHLNQNLFKKELFTEVLHNLMNTLKAAVHRSLKKFAAKLYKVIYIPINNKQTKKAAFYSI